MHELSENSPKLRELLHRSCANMEAVAEWLEVADTLETARAPPDTAVGAPPRAPAPRMMHICQRGAD